MSDNGDKCMARLDLGRCGKPTLSWRDVFECKTAGEYVMRTAEKAKDAGYAFMVHNERVYDVREKDPIETGLMIGDVR